ncbi:phosphoribosylpyrophosphate synthetase [Sinomicrobium weinanense]|uniref:Phosphoribosylpyrophosphate synthetase n=1 Tax=Sinomicrobium weinanense TaxID=2842200 RepID=A0A926JTT3_9FLAO|nr:phosphoribosylpyrophosphate synthetase [Sinomicrobium weinanense]MBC9797383.1 phosphoribosylpyrophosphate synthetase [Sinomicrobium weinanense]MBU3123386.1 phosphoribosylpyrophosphate synthetase [Sinomicrobium weinanense]
MKNAYDTLSEAIDELKKEGFTQDYNLQDKGVKNRQKDSHIPAEDLNVLMMYRFEGSTNPDDNSVLYAIETAKGEKGLLLDAYGVYSGNISREMMDKLRIH